MEEKNKYSIDLNYYVDSDENKAWNNVELHIKKKKQARRKIIYKRTLSIAAAVIAISFAVYVYNEQENKNIAETNFEMPNILRQDDNKVLLIENNSISEIVAEKTNFIASSQDNKKNEKEKSEIVKNTIVVPRCKIHTVTLPDGTVVILNASSKLIFPSEFKGEKREVELIGEGYFDVTKSDKPFIVKYLNNEVRVLGTKFNINAYDDVSVNSATLVSGSVEVSSMINGKINSTIIKPGQQYSFDKSNNEINIEEVDTDCVVSWKSEKFEFNNMRLEDITKQLERWYDVEFEFKTAKAKDYKFTGALSKNDSIKEFVEILQQTAKFKLGYSKDGKIIITK